MSKTILLVEDNPKGDEALTLRALRKHNRSNTVMVARNDVEALDHLLGEDAEGRPADPLPHLVLLDLNCQARRVQSVAPRPSAGIGTAPTLSN